MTTQYFCHNENRRDAVRTAVGADGLPILNGIDFLEVREDQTTLDVHFVHPLPGQPGGVPATPVLTERNFVLVGGVRVGGLRLLAPVVVSDRVITLTVSDRGDYSPYRLSLVASVDSGGAIEGFDPQLSSVEFSFKVGCPTEFDCRRQRVCPPAKTLEPPIDYLARDYSTFRRLLLDRMSVLMPDWKERNPADLGVVLVEAIAYAADQLSYFQDAVATESYLGTARQRISLRRHSRLLDYRMHDGCTARVWVCFEVENGSSADGAELPLGTPLLTRGIDSSVTVDPAGLETELDRGAVIFETLEPATLRYSHNEIRIYTWSDTECCLPRGATCCTFVNDPPLALEPGDVVVFEEVIGPSTGNAADADPARRHAVRLTGVILQDSSGSGLKDPLTGVAIAEVAWSREDALPFPLCLSRLLETQTGGRLIEDVSVARGNVVLADHGLSLREMIENAVGSAGGLQVQCGLARHPVSQQARVRDRLGRTVIGADGEPALFDRNAPAAAAFGWRMGDVLPAVQLIENHDASRPWHSRHDLLDSGRFDRHFVVETDNDGRALLRFGDGRHGRIPSTASTFEARYRVGNGTSGNVGADALSRVAAAGEGFLRVRNPLPGLRGIEKETMEQVRQYAPQAFRVQERAVTEGDYAEVAERHPDAQNAEATLRWTGSWYTAFVTIDRWGGQPVDSEFEREIRAFLERYRLAGQDLEIDGPRPVSLDIVFTVCVKQGYSRSQVKQELLRLFGTRELADGRRGFFHPDALTFGQTIYLSPMIALAMSVPGVRWVDAEDVPTKPNRFRRWGEPSHDEFSAGRIELDRLEIARCDNDPSRPENGRIDFVMEGGL